MYFNGLGHNALTHVECQKKHKASPSLNLAELADFLHVKEKVDSVAKVQLHNVRLHNVIVT
jgi:hypothetical protein